MEPEKLSKTSTTRYLYEYLEDLSRAGVQDFYVGGARGGRSGQNGMKKQNRQDAKKTQIAENVATAQAGRNATSTSRPESLKTSSEEGAAFAAPTKSAPFRVFEPTGDSNAPEFDDRTERLRVICADVARCARCAELAASRTQTVFGSGNPTSELVFVGEGPGADEDAQGLPFVGRSGKLLTDMIEKGMGIPRDSVFICNVVRCRPPQNRNPRPDEAAACRPFLDATLDVVRPKFICCLGSIAAKNLLGVDVPIGRLRGKVHDYRGMKVVCTYHPAYLLRNPPAKKDAWADLQLLMREMGLPTPTK
ncbi:MAG: uracil-DNA glycosylase [Thermoguttaceae bacterium]|nr:uracil-DNA glycosylase [Thermoguttaceae bacterium]MBQ7030711.1 uracil-DNA glycosylase [Thermoguttaceae bacterium]MBQ7111908.1 uracil-DNA glycosylase [Thermoguttaceae bacterium]